MNLRAAFFVLLSATLVPLRGVRAQLPEPPEGSPASSSSVPALPPPAPPADGAPASTPGHTEPSTPVYMPPAPAPSSDQATRADPSLLRDSRYTDTHVDRVVFFPTAETHPEGTLYFSSYEIVLLQAGYALSDRTQVTLSGMPPLRNERVLPFDLSLKTVVARAPHFRLAALGSVSGISGTELGTGVVGRVGGVVQLCWESSCRSSVSVSSNVALIGPAIFAGNAAGLVLRASDHFSVLFEGEAAIPLGTAGNEFNGVAVSTGVRFTGEHFALDLAFAHRADVLAGPALPFLAFTYRVGTK